MATVRRADRLRDQIKKVVSDVIRTRLKDPSVGFVTVTDVKVTRDLQQATIFYSVYGSSIDKKSTNRALQKAKGFIQSELAKQIRVRKVPLLSFEIDKSIEQGMKIQLLLDQIELENDSSDKCS